MPTLVIASYRLVTITTIILSSYIVCDYEVATVELFSDMIYHILLNSADVPPFT